MLLGHAVFALASLFTLSTVASPIPQDDPFGGAALPHYAATLRDTTDHPTPFYLRVSSVSKKFNGHNLQHCKDDQPPTFAAEDLSKAYSTHQNEPRAGPSIPNDYTHPGCINPDFENHVLAFEIRDGQLHNRATDSSGGAGSYTDGGIIAGLANTTSSNTGSTNEFATQTLVLSDVARFAAAGNDADVAFTATHAKWALQITGAFQGVGLYQLVNEAWVGHISPIGNPWQVGWLLCVSDGGTAGLRWFENSLSPVSVPVGCEIVQLVTEMPALGT